MRDGESRRGKKSSTLVVTFSEPTRGKKTKRKNEKSKPFNKNYQSVMRGKKRKPTSKLGNILFSGQEAATETK